MKYSNTVEYNISTKLDGSGLTKLQAQIKQLETSMQKMSNKELIDNEKIQAAKTQLEGLNSALTKSFNPSLGILDLSKFRAELDSSGVSAKGLQSAFNMMGAEGQAALNGLTTQIANFNGGMERTSSAIDKIFTTFSNTFRWGMVSSFFSQFMNAIHQSVDYVKELDNSLTQIMLVTDYNRDSMNEFARSANEAAKAVSMTTTGMTNASLIFAQQGYNLEQSQELATLSAKLANASQQDTATTSDQITAYMNAYGLEDSIGELTQAMDNWALIANVSAADVGELAQASQRAASMAKTVGVSGEQLAAQIATIESVTREAPEQIGNGLKTLYARFSDISQGGEDEDGVKLGDVTKQLNDIGVQILDQFGNIRNVGDIMEDLMVVWDDLDQTSKIAAAQSLAGKYQVNRFVSLMDNSDMYNQYKGATGSAATGTLDIMNAEYADSIAGRSAKMQASLEGLFSTIFNTDDIYPWMDAAQGAVDLLQEFFDALGGGKTVLLGITALLSQAFSQNMARSINDMIANKNLGKIRENNINTVEETLNRAGIDNSEGIGKYIKDTANQAKLGALNDAQYDNYMENIKHWADTSTKLAQSEENLIDNINATNMVYGKLTANKNAAVLDKDGLDTSLAADTRQMMSEKQISQLSQSVDFSDVADDAKNAASALRDLQSNFDLLYLTSEQLAKPIDNAKIAIESLTATEGYSSVRSEKLIEDLEQLRVEIENDGRITDESRLKIQKYINEMERLNTIASEANDTMAKKVLASGGTEAQKAKTDYDFNQIQDQTIEKKALSDQQSIDQQQNIKSVLDMINAVQQLTFAVEAFHNLGSIWKNEDLSKGEKITQIIMNLTAVLFNAISGMKNFHDGMKTVGEMFSSLGSKIIEYGEAIQKKKALEAENAQNEKQYYIEQLQNAQQRIQTEVDEAEAAKITADANVLKAETVLQSAKANLEEAQSVLSSVNADQTKINSIKLIAEAHLAAAQAAIAQAEAEGRIVNPRAEADILEAQELLAQTSAKQIALDERAAKAANDVEKAKQKVATAEETLNKAKEKAIIAEEKLVEKQTLLNDITNKLSSALSGVASVSMIAVNSLSLMEATTIGLTAKIGQLVARIGELGGALLGAAPYVLPLLAVLGTAYGMFKDIEAEKQQRVDEFEESKKQMEETQSIIDASKDFKDKYESFKETGEGGEELATQANEIAQALGEAGDQAAATEIHLAALRAETAGTAESYDQLAKAIENTSQTLEAQNLEDFAQKAFNAAVKEGESVEALISKEYELKQAQEDLNNLQSWDPNYKEKKEELEELIAKDKEFIEQHKEEINYANQGMESALKLGMQEIAKTEGQNMHVFDAKDAATARAGTEALTPGVMDWASMDAYLKEAIPGFAQITDEMTRLSIAEGLVATEAQKAEIQIRELLLSNENLDEFGTKHFSRDGDYTTLGRQGIQNELQNTGFDSEQQVKLLASLDINASEDEIRARIKEIQEAVKNGEDFDIALQASMDPDQLRSLTETRLAEYEPTDEDVSKESFQSTADYLMGHEEDFGKEGTPFEDYSSDILNNAEAMEELVEGILRYNDAIETVTDKAEDWKEALDSNDIERQAEAVDDLQETYGDLLDLPADMEVSEEFAESAENLDLLQEAAEGSEEAYNKLRDAAAEDIIVHAGIEGQENIEAAQEAVSGLLDYVNGADFSNLNIGDAINLEGVDGQLTEVGSWINQLAEQTGWSAQQMSDYLNSIGINIDPNQFEPITSGVEAAEQNVAAASDQMAADMEMEATTTVETDTQKNVDSMQYTSATPQISQVPWDATLPATSGVTGLLSGGQPVGEIPLHGFVPKVEYTATPVTAQDLKEASGSAVKTEVKKGKGSGKGVQLKKGAGATKGATGGAKNAGSSGGGSGGGGRGGGGCFLAGTLITMCGYYQPIEKVKPGQIVLSYNEQLQKNEYSIVLQTMTHDVEEEIYTLYIKDEKLQVTGIHRFFVKRNRLEWVHAENLKVGDWVLFADGTWHLIWKIDVEIQSTLVYNFEVSNNHNYYVGHNRILAHNKGKGGSCFVAGTYVSTSQGFKPIELIRKSDIVVSYNEKTKQNEYSQVLQTMIHNTIEPIYTLYIKDEQLRVTGIHKFLIKSSLFKESKWIAAEDLKVGNWVLFADNTWHLIWKIDVNLELQTVYNFEVANNHNYYVGRNQILAHNKGKGGGGKGGGGGKAKTIEDKEKKEHKKDYYEEVNSQLDKTEKVLSRIAKQEDRLIGDKARAKQNKQLDLLQKEIDIQKEKQKLQQQELKDVDELFKKKQKDAQDLALKNQIASIIPSAMYDEDGVIMNYEQISEALDKIHNQFIDKYNAAAQAGNEDLTKEIDKTLKKFDDYSKEILENAKRHNKLQSEIEETTNKLEELEDKIEDIRIEAYKAHQEAIDDLKDLKEDAAEFDAIFRDYDDNDFFNKWSIDESPFTELLKTLNKLDNIFNISKKDAEAFYDSLIDKKKKALLTADEDEKKAIESSIAYFEQQKGRLTDEGLTNGLLGLAQQDFEQLKGWWDGTNTESNPFGENTAALKEAYEDAYERLKDLQEKYTDLIRDQKDETLDLADAAEKGIERQIDAYDRLNDKLEQINDTYQLYYGEDSYENILKIMDQQANTMESELDQLKSAYSYWQTVYQDALAVGDEDFINEIEDKMNDAEKAMLDKAEELAEHFVDRYEKAVDAGIQKMTNNLWGGGEGQMDLEDQSTIWELQKDYMDTYKDDVEKAYEVDKLRSKYIGLLNDAQGMSLQTQNKIRAQMQEQLDLLQNQKTVSEYDVKLANAKLEILQKQIALEDAQRNKNKMQLRRDTQGNYRYVYTAEQGDVQQAQDELNESQYDAYEMTKEQTIANNDRAINLYQNYMDRMRDIANKYKDDENARVAALAALNQEYSKLLGALEEDFKDTTNGMYDVLTWMVENGTQDTTAAAMDMLDTLYDKNGQVKEDTGVAWRDLASQISDEVLPNIEDEVLETFGNIEDGAAILRQKMTGNNGVLDLIGSSAEKMTDSLSEAKNVTDELAAATEQLFLALGAPKGALKDAIDNLANYANSLKDVQNSNSQLGQALKDSNTDLQAANAEKLHYKTALDYATGAKSLGKGDKIKLKKGTYVHYSRNNSQSDTTGATGWKLPSDTWVRIGEVDPGQANPYGFYSIDTNNKDYFPKDSGKTDNGGGVATVTERHRQNWWFTDTELQKNIMEAMDTGGYTGEWHDQTSLYKNGKVAMLHQKELVLNETDTKNILSAVDMLRQMNASVYSGAFSPIRFNNKNNNPFESTIEQRVEIQATFPNATDADDIRAALLGLSDKAYQYAHRRI